MNKSILKIYIIYPSILYMIFIMILIIPSKNNKLHPMLFMIMLISYTILLSNKMNFMFKSWMPFIMFLVMIGGLMIIYMYITSISNNELFSFNKYMNMKFLIKFLLIMFMIMMTYKLIPSLSMLNLFNEMNFNILNKSSYINMNFMYENNNYWITIFSIMYLLYSLICIMNICYKLNAPLRQLLIYE